MFIVLLYFSWNNVVVSKFSGFPEIPSRIRSSVILYPALEGVNTKSIGFTILTFSLYSALNKISKDLSVPLVK